MSVVAIKARAPSNEAAAGIEIEKGVPLPEKGSASRHAKYPWARMEVGDSFVWPRDPDEFNNILNYASNVAKQAAKRLHVTLETAYRVENGKKIIRVWRTA